MAKAKGNKQSDRENHESMNQVKRKMNFVPLILGAAGGAVVVGAVWAITAAAAPKDVMVAKVGNTPINQSAFLNKLETTSGSQMLQQMISEQLINDAAKKYNITASQQEINNAISGLESQYGISSSDQLNQFLAQNNVTMSDFQNLMKVQVLEGKLAVRNVNVTDQDVQSYYNAHKADFTKQGSKTPEPLSSVKSQIEDAIKQSKALPSGQLLASLAKEDPITIVDTKYNSVKSKIENPPAQQTQPVQ